MHARRGERPVDPEARVADAVRQKVAVAVRWKLLDQLYAPNRMALRLAAEAVVVGAILWSRTGMMWLLPWSGVSLLLLALRAVLSRAYRNVSDNDNPEKWAGRFIVVAWLSGAVWGALSLLILQVADPVAHFIVIGVLWSKLCTVVTRDSGEPRAAFGQVVLMKLPLVLACLARQELVYTAYGIFTSIEIGIARSRIQLLHRQTVGWLKANEKIAVTNSELERANQKLSALATTDALTGMGNRRGFDAAFRREWRRGIREHRPISLLLLDLDYFKKLNDTLGHQAGDDCLQRVADGIRLAIRRPSDVAVRYGGEEFAVVLPDTDAVAARFMAERVRAAIEALGIAHPANPGGFATVSVGAATAVPNDGLMPAALVEQADAALYRAKGAGRNRVCAGEALAGPHPAEPAMQPHGVLPFLLGSPVPAGP